MQSPEAFLRQAQAATALSDFGEPSFEEGLWRLVEALNTEARLTQQGDSFLASRILHHLTQRLQIEDLYRRHPEIEAQVIRGPLIGASLPRTGSTALSCLLARDSRFQSLSAQASQSPGEVLAHPDHADGAVLSHPSGDRQSRFVPAGPEEPAECQELMALSFRSQLFLAFAQIPSYADWLLQVDMRSTYAYEARVLKALQWQSPNRGWRLKAPTHLLYLDAMNEVFPDAKWLVTHRNPVAVMRSVVHLYATYIGQFTDSVDLDYVAELNLRQWSEGAQRMQGFRLRSDPTRFFDVAWADIHQSPIDAVSRIYDWLGVDLTEDFSQGMQAWLDYQQRHRQSIDYPRHEDLHLEVSRIEQAFQDYHRQFLPYMAERGVV